MEKHMDTIYGSSAIDKLYIYRTYKHGIHRIWIDNVEMNIMNDKVDLCALLK